MGERRNFFRLKKRVEIEYKVIIDKFANTAMAPSTALTDTISGNGMSLLAAKKMELGTRLEMTIKLPGTSSVNMTGEIIGNKVIGKDQYELIIKFIDVDEPERDTLIKYILREGVKSKPKNKK